MCVHYGGAHRIVAQALITGILRTLQAHSLLLRGPRVRYLTHAVSLALSMPSPLVDLAALALHLHVEETEKELSSVDMPAGNSQSFLSTRFALLLSQVISPHPFSILSLQFSAYLSHGPIMSLA